MTQRKGLGKGLGMGYKNIIPNYDRHIHSLSAKGVKTKLYSKKINYSETLLPDKEGKYTRQQEHIAFLRGIAQKEDLDNYDLFVEFMDTRFPHEWNPEYIATWVRRFKSGDPVPYMDGESRRTYTSVLKRKYKMDAKGKKKKTKEEEYEEPICENCGWRESRWNFDESLCDECAEKKGLIQAHAKGKKSKKSKLIKVEIYDKDTGEVVETKELTQKGFEGFLYYFSAQAGEDYKFRVV